VQRIWQHRQHLVDGFTSDYGVDQLVYYEMHGTMFDAITREKRLKAWKRKWKLSLIEERNPEWRDLWAEITGAAGSLPSQG
jgi:putative endonuclease